MERSHICAVVVAKTFDRSFRKRSDRLSIPVALLVFNSVRMSDMAFLDTLAKLKGFSSRLSLIEFSHGINGKLVCSNWQFLY